MLEQVTQAVFDRVFEAYKLQPANGLDPDPVKVAFSTTQPSSGDVTRICIGGEDPSGGMTIGSILTDYKNSNRTSVECATLPPTGIFPRELLIVSGEPAFQAVFNPLIPWAGGTPVGAHPADPIVLDPGFDPGSGTPEQLARYQQVQAAIQAFGDALGSIVAHETGHALGLVPAGAPGAGLFGGTVGAQLNHAVQPGGGDAAENFLMNSGYTYTFAKLAGLNGNPLPTSGRSMRLSARPGCDRPAGHRLLRPDVSPSASPIINPTGWTQIFVNEPDSSDAGHSADQSDLHLTRHRRVPGLLGPGAGRSPPRSRPSTTSSSEPGWPGHAPPASIIPNYRSQKKSLL